MYVPMFHDLVFSSEHQPFRFFLQQVERAADLAQIHQQIRSLPEGLEQ